MNSFIKFINDFSLSNSIADILKNPTAIAALAGLLIILIVLLKVKKVKFTTRIITQIGLALALTAVLSLFKIYELPNGGSVTFGSMIPVLLIAFFYGPEIGLITGFLYGIISLILGPWIVHPVQVLFDYPLAFMALGLAGFFKNNKYLGAIVGIFGRFICHYISGVVFFASSAPKGQSPYLFSLIYNGSYLSIDALICLAILAILPLKQLYTIVNKSKY